MTISKAEYTQRKDDYGGEEYAGLRLRFRFRRRVQRHLVDTFAPTAFLVALSWISFWLGTSHTQSRVSLCGIVLLAVLDHLTAARAALPPSRTCTGLDLWTILCLTFVSASIVEVTIVCYCNRLEDRSEIAVGESAMMGLRARRLKGTTRTDSAETQASETTLHLSHSERGVEVNPVSNAGPAELIDKYCRYAFPLTFFVLNIAFWSWLYVNQEP